MIAPQLLVLAFNVLETESPELRIARQKCKSPVKLKFPSFDQYPQTVQFGLLDMAFNLGTNGLVTKSPSFKKAIEAKDWKKAATESNRPQVSAMRNATVKKWLEDAAK